MIKFTTTDGTPIAINPDHIWHVRPGVGTQTAIYSTGGSAVFVAESYELVVEMLERRTSH